MWRRMRQRVQWRVWWRIWQRVWRLCDGTVRATRSWRVYAYPALPCTQSKHSVEVTPYPARASAASFARELDARHVRCFLYRSNAQRSPLFRCRVRSTARCLLTPAQPL